MLDRLTNDFLFSDPTCNGIRSVLKVQTVLLGNYFIVLLSYEVMTIDDNYKVKEFHTFVMYI